MSIPATSTRPPDFLESSIGHDISQFNAQNAKRPYVTLTFAQSLDAKIAGKDGRQLILSGKQSMIMTHWMRTMHDAILVGIGTALNDDPQLNTRHLPSCPADPIAGHNNPYHLPRPIILDSQLRLSPDCKLLKNYRGGQGRRPWVVCPLPSSIQGKWEVRLNALEEAGARIIQVPTTNGKLSLSNALEALRNLGTYSLMVEGGAKVIRSFLAEANHGVRVIDALIITIAPTLVGEDGIGYGAGLAGDQIPNLKHVSTQTVGIDSVVVMKSI